MIDANSATTGAIAICNLGGGTFAGVLTAYVTSATTFAVMTQFTGNLTKGNHWSNVSASAALNFRIVMGINPGSRAGPNSHPYEAYCASANAVPACGASHVHSDLCNRCVRESDFQHDSGESRGRTVWSIPNIAMSTGIRSARTIRIVTR